MALNLVNPAKGSLLEKHTKELEKFIKLEVRVLAAVYHPAARRAVGCSHDDDSRRTTHTPLRLPFPREGGV
jgi:hypothetical protein